MSDSDRTMSGKVCLVTGATSGIGAATARELARRGAAVVLVGRDPARCEAAVARIRRETGRSDADSLHADLSSQAEVRGLALKFRERHARLDVLINNAGALFPERRASPDGLELTFALNHLAYFLLTNLLLDRLRAGAAARIVNVASDAHRFAALDFDDLQSERSYRGFRTYCRSKLANLLFTFELARRMEGTGVTANALHPGFVASNFIAGRGFTFWLMRRLAGVAAISPEAGARTSIHLASAPEVAGVTGRYFERCRPVAPSPAARDEAAARRLWEISEELTGLSAARAS